jgi:hypothetical protein
MFLKSLSFFICSENFAIDKSIFAEEKLPETVEHRKRSKRRGLPTWNTSPKCNGSGYIPQIRGLVFQSLCQQNAHG